MKAIFVMIFTIFFLQVRVVAEDDFYKYMPVSFRLNYKEIKPKPDDATFEL